MKIKNVVMTFVFLLCFTSCTTTSFTTFYNEPITAAGYTNEKWLFVASEAPLNLQKNFDKQIIEFLEGCYGNNFINYKTNQNQYLLPDFPYQVHKDMFINSLHQSGEIIFICI